LYLYVQGKAKDEDTETSTNIYYSTKLKTKGLNLHQRRCEDIKLSLPELPLTASEWIRMVQDRFQWRAAD
jgi:hypothetical protein